MDSPPTGTVTFLFTDIERSTKRWEHDALAMQAALARIGKGRRRGSKPTTLGADCLTLLADSGSPTVRRRSRPSAALGLVVGMLTWSGCGCEACRVWKSGHACPGWGR